MVLIPPTFPERGSFTWSMGNLLVMIDPSACGHRSWNAPISVIASAKLCRLAFTVPSTTHADADYRRAVLPVLVRRAVSAALDNGGIR